MLKTAFKKFEEILSARRLYPFKLFKVCLPQNLLSPCLNTLSHISLSLRLRNTGLVFIGVIFTLWEEGATVAVVGYISGDGVTSLASDLFLLCWSKLNLILYINWSWLWETPKYLLTASNTQFGRVWKDGIPDGFPEFWCSGMCSYRCALRFTWIWDGPRFRTLAILIIETKQRAPGLSTKYEFDVPRLAKIAWMGSMLLPPPSGIMAPQATGNSTDANWRIFNRLNGVDGAVLYCILLYCFIFYLCIITMYKVLQYIYAQAE